MYVCIYVCMYRERGFNQSCIGHVGEIIYIYIYIYNHISMKKIIISLKVILSFIN